MAMTSIQGLLKKKKRENIIGTQNDRMGGFNLPFLGGDHDPRSVCSLYRLEKERESVCLYSPPKAQLADTVVLVQLKELGWTSARQD